MIHIAVKQTDIERLEWLFYHSRDEEGNYVILRQEIVQDGEYFGLHVRDFIFWTNTKDVFTPTIFADDTVGHSQPMPVTMRCPQAIKDDLHENKTRSH